MRYSANIEQLRPSATIAMSTLAKRLTEEGRDIINLSAGEPDFDTPVFVADAAVAGIRGGQTKYTPPPGLTPLRKAIAEHLSQRAGRALDWTGVVVTAGAKQALFNAIFCLFGPGDDVIVAAPYWTTYPDLVQIARAKPVYVFGEEANGFKLNPTILDTAVTESTRGLILNTPSNPTGAVYTVEELEAIAGWARDHGIWIISDEIYRNIYHGDDRTAAPGLLDLSEDILGDFVLVDGASKSYAMTGWRLGYSYSTPELAAKFAALESQITSNAATPSQVAALEAFGNTTAAAASVAEMAAAFRRRRDLVTERVDELMPGVTYIRPQGAFYLYFRVDHLFNDEVKDSTAWCSALLERTGVALVPGGAFGDERWARMSFAASEASIEEAMRRMAPVVNGG